ncbi:hypothetical protein, partial [Rhodovulum bhavnagarense]|uniref:hypothetical protein n=1 Tax=Rhodovulum bhavnagarense TaxID=992286 RepID=UPI003C7D0B00
AYRSSWKFWQASAPATIRHPLKPRHPVSRIAPLWLLTHGPARKALGLILTAAAILLFLLNLRRAGERAGRAAERLDLRERNDAVHRQMLDAAARRPPDRDALADRLRDGRF